MHKENKNKIVLLCKAYELCQLKSVAVHYSFLKGASWHWSPLFLLIVGGSEAFLIDHALKFHGGLED